MPKSLKVGVAIEETWAFFHEIYADFQKNFKVDLFERKSQNYPIFTERINRHNFDRELRYILQKNDVVFFEWASELLVAASQLPKTCGIVARLHRYELYRWIDQINWDLVDHLIVVTEAKRYEFLSRIPEMSSRISVIPEAVSLERFKPHERVFRGDIGTLCSLIPRKRVYELILAFSELIKEYPNMHLHIGGPERDIYSEYAQALYRLTRRLNLQDQIKFYGKVNNPETWYQNLDIFISNSYSEGLQVALLEAMASGVYCLSHDWEGAEEILPKEQLYFSEQELIQRLKQYFHYSDEQRAIEKARMVDSVVAKSDIQHTVLAIRALVEQIGSTWREYQSAE